MPDSDPLRLPSIPSEWKREARKHHVLDTSVHDLLKVESASSIGLAQYYSLRVLWKVQSDELPDATFLGLTHTGNSYLDARCFLKTESPSWQRYLEGIRSSSGVPSVDDICDIGAFSNVRYCQLLVELSSTAYATEKTVESDPSKSSPRRLRSAVPASADSEAYSATTPTRGQNLTRRLSTLSEGSPFGDTSVVTHDTIIPPSPRDPATKETTGPAEDEQIVNVALVLWLQTLPMFHPLIQGEDLRWSLKRLKFGFRDWEARTDGCLRRGDEIKAIIEVKPYVRSYFSTKIQKQESAEMAAWIFNCPDDGGWFVQEEKGGNERLVRITVYEHSADSSRRLLISQDVSEIYLTVAEFGSAYKAYLRVDRPNKISEPSFMTMTQYGPWDTMNADHMRQLGQLLLAFTLKHRETRNGTYISKRPPPPTPPIPQGLRDKKKAAGMTGMTRASEDHGSNGTTDWGKTPEPMLSPKRAPPPTPPKPKDLSDKNKAAAMTGMTRASEDHGATDWGKSPGPMLAPPSLPLRSKGLGIKTTNRPWLGLSRRLEQLGRPERTDRQEEDPSRITRRLSGPEEVEGTTKDSNQRSEKSERSALPQMPTEGLGMLESLGSSGKLGPDECACRMPRSPGELTQDFVMNLKKLKNVTDDKRCFYDACRPCPFFHAHYLLG